MRALAIVGSALVVIVAVVLVRAATLSSHQLEVAPAPVLEIDPKPMAERLALAVHHPTVSYQDPDRLPRDEFRGLATLLRVAYPLTHATLEVETISDFTLLYTWRGSDPTLEPILLAAHQDVVPVDADSEGEWEEPPFQGVVRDGVVWGRGTIDDKASMICLLEAVERLIADGFQPQRTVLLAFGHDEEVGGDAGAGAVAARLAEEGTRLAWVLDEGGLVARDFFAGIATQVAVVGIAEKGSVGIALEIEAPGGHSSTPPRHTAIGDLSRALVALEENPLPASLDGTTSLFMDTLAPELPFPARVVLANRWLFGPLLPLVFARMAPLDAMVRSTTAATIFEAGVKENVLPVRARAVVNFRIHPNDTVESVTEHVRRTIDDDRIEIQVGVRSQPRNSSPVSPVDSEAFRNLARTIRSIFTDAVVVPYLLVGGSDARHYYRVSDHVYRFLPFVYGPETVRLAHGTNERISIENLAGGVRFYVQLLRTGAGQE